MKTTAEYLTILRTYMIENAHKYGGGNYIRR